MSAQVSVMALESRHARYLMRRNYRWMRQDGVSPTVARIILDSTLWAARLDGLHARHESIVAA